MKRGILAAAAGLTMAVAISASASAYVLDGRRWDPGPDPAPATITWSLMGGGLDTDWGAGTSVDLSTFMPTGFEDEIDRAFDAWEAAAGLDFIRVADPGVGWQEAGAETVDIRITGHAFDGAGGVLAHGFFPPPNGGAAAGDIHFDVAELWKIGFGGDGFDIFQVAAHEIGHAIGLRHETFVTALMNPFYTETFSGLLADDIAGARAIYGPPPVRVPEPGAAMVMVVGLIGLGAARRRAARKAAA